MKPKPSVSLFVGPGDMAYVRRLVEGMGFRQTRGAAFGRGSLNQFVGYLAAGEVVAFPVLREAYELDEAADRFEALAETEYPGSPAQDMLRSAAKAMRTAARRVAELDEPDVDDDEPGEPDSVADLIGDPEFEAGVAAGQAMANIGAALRARREAAGLTQAEVAARLGISRAWLAQIEQGKETKLTTLVAFAAAVGAGLEIGVVSAEAH